METVQIHPFFLNRLYDTFGLLFINLTLGAFVNYVIWTQSKSLGSFKYYLLNQTIWAQLLEILFTALCPVFICPYIGGFLTGFLRTVSPQVTGVLTIFGYCCFINTAFGVFLSLFNRLIFTFHYNLKSYFHNKYTFAVIVVLHILPTSLVALLVLAGMEDADSLRKTIINETQDALKPFLNETSLIYVSEFGGLSRKACIAFFVLVTAFTCVLLGSIVVFLWNVFTSKQTSTAVSKNASSLVLSSLVQSFLCLTLLFIPAESISFIWGFRIENSANTMNFLGLMVNIHGTIDMICILCFVKPYRVYCIKLCFKVVNKVRPQNVVIVSTCKTGPSHNSFL